MKLATLVKRNRVTQDLRDWRDWLERWVTRAPHNLVKLDWQVMQETRVLHS